MRKISPSGFIQVGKPAALGEISASKRLVRKMEGRNEDNGAPNSPAVTDVAIRASVPDQFAITPALMLPARLFEISALALVR